MSSSLSLSSLPNEIIFIISNHLRPYDLTRFAQISKQFLHLLAGEIDKAAARYVRKDNYTVLGWAVLKEFFPLAERLLQKGSHPDERARRGMRSPFQLAVKRGHLKMAERFIKAGATVTDPPTFSMASGNADMIRLLAVNAGNDPDSEYFELALEQAVEYGEVAIFELLLDHLVGSRPVAAFIDDMALLKTAAGGSEEMVQYLLDRGANASHISGCEDESHISGCDDDSPSTPVRAAAWSGNIRIVRMLVDAGADIATRVDYDRCTVLHLQALKDDEKAIEMAEELLNLGADLSWTDYEQMTPLHWAAREGNHEIAKFFIERGADTRAQDHLGRTPLDIALLNSPRNESLMKSLQVGRARSLTL